VTRQVRTIVGPDGLQWKVKLLVVPVGMRPSAPIEVLDMATPRRNYVEGVGRLPDAISGPTGPVPLGFVLLLLTFPFLPLVLLLRRLRILPWTVEARTYPWGRRFPPVVLAYEIRGRQAALAALDELAASLARGDGAPAIAGAELVRQPRTVHGG
jgi:hypothetical protein